jgi:hypothetical protein
VTIDDETLERMLLWEAVEGGELYMTVWELNTMRPGDPEEMRIDQIRVALARLVDRGWIWLSWERGQRELGPLSGSEAEAELADPARWRPVDPDEPVIALNITPEGDRELRKRVNGG